MYVVIRWFWTHFYVKPMAKFLIVIIKCLYIHISTKALFLRSFHRFANLAYKDLFVTSRGTFIVSFFYFKSRL